VVGPGPGVALVVSAAVAAKPVVITLTQAAVIGKGVDLMADTECYSGSKIAGPVVHGPFHATVMTRVAPTVLMMGMSALALGRTPQKHGPKMSAAVECICGHFGSVGQ
jgi:hypothetical protein